MNMNTYYNQNAQAFYDGTITVDMKPLYEKVLPFIPEGGLIIDAGCGSGRDSKYFASLGHKVQAFDASEALVALARQYSGIAVITSTFFEFNSRVDEANAIWACASLLHVPADELNVTFLHLSKFLKPKGVFYCSFKYGDEELERDGRCFTNVNEESLPKYLLDSDLQIKETWVTNDLRLGRENEQWLNAILIKV